MGALNTQMNLSVSVGIPEEFSCFINIPIQKVEIKTNYGCLLGVFNLSIQNYACFGIMV